LLSALNVLPHCGVTTHLLPAGSPRIFGGYVRVSPTRASCSDLGSLSATFRPMRGARSSRTPVCAPNCTSYDEISNGAIHLASVMQFSVLGFVIGRYDLRMMLSPGMIASVAVHCTTKIQWKSSFPPDLARIQTSNLFEATDGHGSIQQLSNGESECRIIYHRNSYRHACILLRNNHCNVERPVKVKQCENHNSKYLQVPDSLTRKVKSRTLRPRRPINLRLILP
jgi:hypothetical protein